MNWQQHRCAHKAKLQDMNTVSIERHPWLTAFRAAFPYTAPVGFGFLVLGLSYGMLMGIHGFSVLYPLCMSALIFAGSMEFVTVSLLLSPFDPIAAFTLAIMVNARHLFYGIAMLPRFAGTGWVKPLLIYGLCDETFALHVATRAPKGIDEKKFMLATTLLNQAYWVLSSTLGGLIGARLPQHTQGLEFVLTALFVVIALDQWQGQGLSGRAGIVLGLVISALCVIVFGPSRFMIPALVGIVAVCFILRSRLE